MSLTNNKTLLITFCVLILVIMSVSFLFPNIQENIITGLASLGSFPVSLSIIHASFDISNRTQLDSVLVNGPNITIKMPVNYYDDITMNLSLNMPTGFESGFDWYINESGTIKNVSVNGTSLSWEADKSIKNTYLYFEVAAPLIISEAAYTGDSYYEKTILINASCLLINVSVNVSVSANYEDYVLYLIENNTLINRTAEYNLQISNARATFYGFNISDNKTFRIQTAINATYVEIPAPPGGGGGGGGIPPSVPGRRFSVEPETINITTQLQKVLQEIINITNLQHVARDFTITHTDNFISYIVSNINIPANQSEIVLIYIDTTNLGAGKYTDYIYVEALGKMENVTVDLELILPGSLAGAEEEPVPKEPEEEVTAQVTKEPEKEQPKPKVPVPEAEFQFNLLPALLLALIVLLILSLLLSLHLRKLPQDVSVKEYLEIRKFRIEQGIKSIFKRKKHK